MSTVMHPARHRGFTLIELMVTIAVVAIMMALAVPYFGGANKAARERGVVNKFQQDFDWARSAAGASDATTLGVAGATGIPAVTMNVYTDCHWEVVINGAVIDASHSLTAQQLSVQAPGLTCASGVAGLAPLAYTGGKAIFTFSPQGTVTPSGSVTITGSNGTTWPLQFLFSGSIINTKQAS